MAMTSVKIKQQQNRKKVEEKQDSGALVNAGKMV